jgi:hypothetical protein
VIILKPFCRKFSIQLVTLHRLVPQKSLRIFLILNLRFDPLLHLQWDQTRLLEFVLLAYLIAEDANFLSESFWPQAEYGSKALDHHFILRWGKGEVREVVKPILQLLDLLLPMAQVRVFWNA